MHFEILGKWLCAVTLLTATAVFSAEQPKGAIDARYPAMAEWAKAGVTGGIPASLPLVATAKPGDDIQAIINGASPNGGVIAFAPGEYVLTEPLQLRSGVFLRGANLRTTKLHFKMRGAHPPVTAPGSPPGLPECCCSRWSAPASPISRSFSTNPCRHNVMVNARIEGDIRFRDAATANNLLQNGVIAVPAWHNRPALSQRTEAGDDRPPGPGNLLYLCTVTRSFMSDGRSFSLADNPTRVYRVLEVFSNEASVADAGPEPVTGSLWLAR